MHAVSVLLMSLSLFALVRALAPLAEEAQPSRPSAPCSLMEGDTQAARRVWCRPKESSSLDSNHCTRVAAPALETSLAFRSPFANLPCGCQGYSWRRRVWGWHTGWRSVRWRWWRWCRWRGRLGSWSRPVVRRANVGGVAAPAAPVVEQVPAAIPAIDAQPAISSVVAVRLTVRNRANKPWLRRTPCARSNRGPVAALRLHTTVHRVASASTAPVIGAVHTSRPNIVIAILGLRLLCDSEGSEHEHVGSLGTAV